MTRGWICCAVLSAAMLVGCGTAPQGNGAGAAGATGARAPEAKMVALPFRLDVTFSASALAKLRETNSQVSVTADYHGPPKAAKTSGLDPELGVWLGGETYTIEPGTQSLTLKGRIDAAQVARDVEGDARVRVQAATGPDVTCTGFDEYLPIAVETGGTVECRLAGE